MCYGAFLCVLIIGRYTMFTGIVEETGTIVGIKKGTLSEVLSIRGPVVTSDAKVGDSIAVNGVCLTVTSLSGDTFTADVMAETMRRSSLGMLKAGSKVNLERAMPADGRFGGHIVSGHIDGTGRVLSKRKEDNATWVKIEAPADILRLMVPKGSIAIDGISLTVVDVTDTYFSVSIIPHTGSATTLLDRLPGDTVNLENDIIAKYVDRLLGRDTAPSAKPGGLTFEMLANNGFM